MDIPKEYSTIELVCESVVGEDSESYRYCGNKARWIAEWSDRRMIVCDEHISDVQENYDGDHEYDQTGINWTKIVYHDDIDDTIVYRTMSIRGDEDAVVK